MSKFTSGQTLKSLMNNPLLGTDTDAEIGKKLGVNKVYVTLARQMAEIPSYAETKREKRTGRTETRADRMERKIDDLAIAMNTLLIELGANK